MIIYTSVIIVQWTGFTGVDPKFLKGAHKAKNNSRNMEKEATNQKGF